MVQLHALQPGNVQFSLMLTVMLSYGHINLGQSCPHKHRCSAFPRRLINCMRDQREPVSPDLPNCLFFTWTTAMLLVLVLVPVVVALPPHAVHPPGPHAGRQPSQNTASQDPYSAAHGLHAVQECKNFVLLRTGVQKNPRVEGGIQEADSSSSSGLYLIDLAHLAHIILMDCSQAISRGSVAAMQEVP